MKLKELFNKNKKFKDYVITLHINNVQHTFPDYEILKKYKPEFLDGKVMKYQKNKTYVFPIEKYRPRIEIGVEIENIIIWTNKNNGKGNAKKELVNKRDIRKAQYELFNVLFKT